MDLETPPTFRRAWRGYHPDDVDRFLKETAEERERLREALARVEMLIAECQDGPAQIVEAARREADEIRTAAKVQAREFLEEVRRRITEPATRPAFLEPPRSAPAGTELQVIAEPVSTPAQSPRPAPRVRIHEWDLRSLHPEPAPRYGRNMVRMAGIAAACLLVVVVQAVDFRGAKALLGMNTQSLGAATAPAPSKSSVVQPLDQDSARTNPTLTLTITALRPCWVRMVLDGKHEMERMLKAQETVVLHAREEALLKAGDAGALSLLVNNRATRPLGASGQVVTQLITRANYASLLQ